MEYNIDWIFYLLFDVLVTVQSELQRFFSNVYKYLNSVKFIMESGIRNYQIFRTFILNYESIFLIVKVTYLLIYLKQECAFYWTGMIVCFKSK